jgi:hypothetical protein
MSSGYSRFTIFSHIFVLTYERSFNSSTKSLTAIVFASLVDRGLVNYEDKVAKHWPEFGTFGKENLRICDVLRYGFVNTNSFVILMQMPFIPIFQA